MSVIAAVRSRLSEFRWFRPAAPGNPGGFCWYSCRDTNTGLTMICHQKAHTGSQHEDHVYGTFYSAAPVPATPRQRGHRKTGR